MSNYARYQQIDGGPSAQPVASGSRVRRVLGKLTQDVFRRQSGDPPHGPGKRTLISRVSSFWREAVRPELQRAEAAERQLADECSNLSSEVLSLKSRLSQVMLPPSTEGRPPPSAAITQRQADGLRHVCQEAERFELDGSSSKLWQVQPSWALDKLVAARSQDGSLPNPLGCWFPKVRPMVNEYRRFNYRNTRWPVRSSTSPDSYVLEAAEAQSYYHHLAVVAKREGATLLLVLPGRKDSNGIAYEVSHLCHNGQCFNPDHCVVEPRHENHRRNECQNRYILNLPGGKKVDLCPH
uniref:Putative homing endonuclease n=2 Tax=Cordycipitaceae TaxID=474943 RepID=Q8TGD0_BEABA|nr:putative homing endonuclease [Cordyceps farinosa]BAB86285.1 putative homing endonuclease [Beauveria bassiana]BAE46602.1 putative homing endonuclease [Beauveria bassiana]